MEADVLVVGAGPTGLLLALWLRRFGVRIRIVDKDEGPGETSRALAVQARTLEYHRQIGIIDEVLAAGVRLEQLTARTPAGIGATLRLSDFGKGVSPYSFAFALPQDIHERILIEQLEKDGTRVERRTELVGFEETADGIVATLRKDGATETVKAAYICGCDGAHSAVRHVLKLGFPGGAYDQSFYVADVKGSGEITQNGLDVRLGRYGFAIIMPVRQLGSLRLIGIVPQEHEKDEQVTFEAIRDDIERDTRIKVESVNWFSHYRVHHRVADHFRVGRAFIAGDAGHIHSPAGGQGMNTGMGDAVNLAWKLAAVVQGRADARLLDSYEPERIAFARLLIESTDRAFRLVTGRSWLSGIWRRYIMAPMMALVMSTRRGSRAFFGLISQTRINYRNSPLSVGATGELKAGDRLPYVVLESGDNFDPLKSLDWQLHVYGVANAALATAMSNRGMALHVFPWSETAATAGLTRDAAYLVRPDGHIAVATPAGHAAPIERYLDEWKIVPRA